MILGLVRNGGVNGVLGENPFNFDHNNLTELKVYLNGELCGIKPLELNYEAGEYILAYRNLFTALGKVNQDESINITRWEYPNGFALYAYDLTPDSCTNECFSLIKNATVRVDLKFADALTNALTLIVVLEFENIIENDRNRNVIYDITA